MGFLKAIGTIVENSHIVNSGDLKQLDYFCMALPQRAVWLNR
ncbi:MAG TPA: hypothetical protein PK052_10445 [Anaerohalosphaeraceae bacterium]|nr:hypothetical protein [Anaerohalosphaeraceae bacterium]HOL32389.1 hypothetical protein [Anaerohalosphaeraceae bacterium]HOM75832.1 hypothetical protein [Anaerohalosphaeraceae bacterium]HPC64108.1 hypothetical protein [Anaerohalosphaeraceae bacterium]HPO70530.1 hypothetical protein [Anaerohalosphaeraceae bacterium]